jgi:hypothetical protein
MWRKWENKSKFPAAQLVTFDSLRDMMLNFCIKRKIKRMKRRRDGTGLSSADTIANVSETDDKMYSVPFYKSGRLEYLESAPFGYIHVDQGDACNQCVS